MKKISSFFISCLFIVSSILFSSNVYAAEYNACIAVFCDNTELAQNYIEKLYGYEYNDDTRQLIKLSKANDNKNVVVHSHYGSIKYNVYFNVINSNLVLNPSHELGSFLKNCTGALIIYDISDEKLTPIVKSNTYYKDNVSSFIKMDNTLNNCIRYLESFGRNGWYNALNFVTYGKEKLTPEIYEERREQLNRYTLGVEALYVDGDNKWGRGHPDVSTEGSIKNQIAWSAGEVYRSIFMEKALSGKFSGLSFKKNESFESCFNSNSTRNFTTRPNSKSTGGMGDKKEDEYSSSSNDDERLRNSGKRSSANATKYDTGYTEFEERNTSKKWFSKILVFLATAAGIIGLIGTCKWLKAKFFK